MGILEFLFGPSLPDMGALPKVGETVRMKDTREAGTIAEVKRSGGGLFETYATCKINLADGTVRTLSETEFERA